MKAVAVFFVAFAVVASHGYESSPSLHVSFERYVEMMKLINSSPLLKEEWAKHMALQREDPVLADIRSRQRTQTFRTNCVEGNRSPARPTSVHRLKPGDIDVIGAMGDSLTAGNGVLAWTILGCLTEYRGRSWSIGGDSSYSDGVTTLPNILREFNPNLKGFSVGSGDQNSRGAVFNVAEAGDVAQDMPRQAVNLVNKIRSDSSVNFQNDWKMVTLFIGGNNLCAYCEDLNAHSADTYIANIAQALDYLRDNMPRTFVNLVEIFDISPVAQLGNGIICSLVHNAVCGCGHGADADTVALTELSRQYQRAVRNLVDSGRYDGKEDFTVVSQPFFRETSPPAKSDGSPDLSYFAPDCFHFSGKGQNAAGKALWNTINQPIGRKFDNWKLDEPVNCPITTYIPTRFN